MKKQYAAAISINELEVYFAKKDFDLEKNKKAVLEEGYVEPIIIASIEKGLKDGSVRKDIDPTAAFDVLSMGYKGLLQRIAFIYSTTKMEKANLAERTIESFVHVISTYLKK